MVINFPQKVKPRQKKITKLKKKKGKKKDKEK
jgi:hypothetical protein